MRGIDDGSGAQQHDVTLKGLCSLALGHRNVCGYRSSNVPGYRSSLGHPMHLRYSAIGLKAAAKLQSGVLPVPSPEEKVVKAHFDQK